MVTSEERSDTLQRLDLDGSTGVWAIRSSSSTVYYVDCDTRSLLRAWGGPGSPEMAYDDKWMPLVEVTCYDRTAAVVATDAVVVGTRPKYLADPSGGIYPYQWRLSRMVESIERLPDEEAERWRRHGRTTPAP